MKNRRTGLIMVAAVIAAFASLAEATIFIKGHNKTFPPDSVYTDDVYVGLNKSRFESTVKGDLVGASQELAYSGKTDGNLIWGCRAMSINGPVGGTFIAFAQDVEINAQVMRNFIAFASKVISGPAYSVARDMTVFCKELAFDGICGGDLRAFCESAEISGTVKGDVRVKADNLAFGSNAVVDGDVYFEGPTMAKIPEGAKIQGEIHWKVPSPKERQPSYKAFLPIIISMAVYIVFNWIFTLIAFLLAILLNNIVFTALTLLAMIVSGIVVIALSKKSAMKAVSALETQTWTSLGLGFVLLLLFPPAAGLAMLTIVGIPLSLLILFGYGIALFAGSVYACLYTGRLVCRLLRIERKEPGYLCYILGVAIIGGLALIPIIRWIAILAVMMMGIGSVVLATGKLGRKLPLEKAASE